MKEGARFRIVDLGTGRRWDVEAIRPRHQRRIKFGDSLHESCAGAIAESESRISEETHGKVRYIANPSEVDD
ncbi:MAG TPA: hypothetical protein VN937_00890 [Blastocatellia bacterium]|nr:hypothetical protein [Blastocatellia bacterium]